MALHLLSRRNYERIDPERNEDPVVDKQRPGLQVEQDSFEAGRSYQHELVGRRTPPRDTGRRPGK